MVAFKETFSVRTTNAAQFDAGAIIVIEDLKNAKINNNIPHNTATITNTDTTSTLHIWLDHRVDEKPDFVLFANQTMTINAEEGFHWTHLFIENTHATNNIAADAVKVRMGTAKRLEEL